MNPIGIVIVVVVVIAFTIILLLKFNENDEGVLKLNFFEYKFENM